MQGTPSHTTGHIPRWAIAADLVAGLALVLGLWTLVTGGLDLVREFGFRLSMRSAMRPLALGVLLLAIRHYLVPRHPRILALIRSVDLRRTEQAHLLGRFGPHRLVEFAVVTLGFAALVAAVTWPQIVNLYGVPDTGDPLFSVWRVSWVAHQVLADPLHLFDANIFHPEPLTLTYSDSLLIPALAAAPFLWLGAPPLPTYTLLFLSGWVFSGVATYYLVRALTGRRDAAVVAGVIFAIYPYRSEHYSHLELQMTMAMPLTLWCLHRTIASGRMRDGILTGLAYATQMLSSLYYGLFLAVYLVPLGAVLWIARRCPRRALLALALGGVIAGAIIAPVALAYTASKPTLGDRPVDAIEAYSAVPGDYLIPHFRSAVYGRWEAGGRPERQLLPGVVAIGLALLALWPPIGIARLAYLLAGLVAFDGSLGLNGVLYPWLHEHISPFRGMRVPARFSILVGLTLAVLAGYGVARVLNRFPRWRIWLTAAFVVLLVVDMRPNIQLEPVRRYPPAIYSVIPTGPESVLAEFPIGRRRGILYAYQYMYFSTSHWLRMLNGGSGYFPPSWEEFLERGSEFPSDRSLDYLRSRQVKYLVVHGGLYEDPGQFEQIRAALLARPDLEWIAAERDGGGTTELYRFR